jgi:hypothetical protein
MESKMKIEILNQNYNLIKSVRKSLSVDGNDTSIDNKISNMTHEEVFEYFLNWQGIVGSANKILKIYGILKGSLEDDLIVYDHLAANDSEDIIETLRKYGRFPEFNSKEFNEDLFDSYVNKMTLIEAFDSYLSYKGIIKSTEEITNAIETLNSARESF